MLATFCNTIAYCIFLFSGTTHNYVVTIVYMILFTVYAVQTMIYGCGGMNHVELGGLYKVGVRSFKFKSTDSEWLVFYPIDQQEFDKKKNTHQFKYF